MAPRLQKRFDVLAAIHRASYFQWLRTAAIVCPEASQRELVATFWTEVGHETARNYLSHIDRSNPLPREIAVNVVFSSICMGEDAVLIDGDHNEAYVEHRNCPWFEWHAKKGMLDQDQFGCDTWIDTFVTDINDDLQSNVRWETTRSLPQGDNVCLRRFWKE